MRGGGGEGKGGVVAAGGVALAKAARSGGCVGARIGIGIGTVVVIGSHGDAWPWLSSCVLGCSLCARDDASQAKGSRVERERVLGVSWSSQMSPHRGAHC